MAAFTLHKLYALLLLRLKSSLYLPPDSSSHPSHLYRHGSWDQYLFRCWLVAADNSFIFRILGTHKPDSALFLEAKATGQYEYMRWRAMTLEGKVDVPDIHTCPVYTTAGNSNRLRKGATRTGVKLQKTIKDREDFKFEFKKSKK